AAIGALSGALTGLLRSLHKPEFARLANDVGRDLGVQISDGLAKALADQEKTLNLGRFEVERLNLDKIIGEAGGVQAFGVEKAIRATRDLFSLLDTGRLTAQ